MKAEKLIRWHEKRQRELFDLHLFLSLHLICSRRSYICRNYEKEDGGKLTNAAVERSVKAFVIQPLWM